MRSAARAVLTALLLVGTLIAASACGAGSPAATTTEPATGTTPAASPASSPAMADRSATTPAAGSAAFPDVHLPGVNDPNCTSSDRPVVLLPGTFSTVAGNFGALAAALQADGRCVYGLNYGLGGVAPVRDSAAAAAGFVDDVRRATGADQVDVVAFSQGGLVLRTALRLTAPAPAVGTAVLIAPTFHGSTSDLLTGVPAAACPACADQTAGSPLLTELNAGGDLDGDVRYATISSRDDTVVTPVGAQSPVGPDDRVRSLIVQDRCPDLRLDHLDLPGDPGVIGWVRQALATDGRPDPSAYRCR
jgi:triacylglycerol lipase